MAFWNKETGNVWAESSDGWTKVEVAAGVASPLAAYDALGAAGFVRRGDWLIVPGISHLRQVTVARQENL
ncbi:hypothetical protein B5P44_00810 [Mycobacterium sp. CBMA 213]|uniref:hypothetical protein n=1 Tax=Mycolicibacterium sp. CBMA 335 TaxID=2606603 RepID=UPI00192E527A|nr:hypothetical protein [Mycolicibacterium sp. CBMA 335]MUM03363.1 hypothetical protein [Mycolicibacterium sp. CBMA 213]